jgi:hypothetical protein
MCPAMSLRMVLVAAPVGGFCRMGSHRHGCPGVQRTSRLQEFLGRFTVGASAQHHNAPPGYYSFTYSSARCRSLVIAAIFAMKPVRRALWNDHVLLWLDAGSLAD